MSFKREGNDSNLLGILRRRRIRELLSEDIPHDEAKLLSNGRFACLVCTHRPVFDTVDMLTHHRHGKKHQIGKEWHEHKKQELNELIKQRQMEQAIKTGNSSILVSSSHSGGKLVTGAEYDPRVKKHKHKPYDRKLKLCLGNDNDNSDTFQPATSLPNEKLHQHTKQSQLNMNDIYEDKQTVNNPCLNSEAAMYSTASKHSSHDMIKSSSSNVGSAGVAIEQSPSRIQTDSRIQSSNCLFERILSSNEPIMHTSNLKQLVASSRTDRQSCGPVRPYISNKHSLRNQEDDDPSQTSNSVVSGCTNWDTVLADMRPLDRAVVSGIPDACLRLPPPAPPPQLPAQIPPASQLPVQLPILPILQAQLLPEQITSAASAAIQTVSSPELEVDSRKARAERYIQLTQAGWKWDYKADKWVKDEDAEFDSDEEPPDPS